MRTFRYLPLYLRERRWFFIALGVGAVILSLPRPEGLTEAGLIVLAMSVVATILFVTEPVPLPTVALLIVVGQIVLMGLDSTRVATSLMNDSVLFIMGSLMLAVAVVRQKLDKRIAYLIIRIAGTRTSRVCICISAASGVLASFIGEHTVAAMILPVGITLITLTSEDPGKVRGLAAVILSSISYGCSIAGFGTPSGGARNNIMIGYFSTDTHGDADAIAIDVTNLAQCRIRVSGRIDGYVKVGDPLKGNPFVHCPTFDWEVSGAELMEEGGVAAGVGRHGFIPGGRAHERHADAARRAGHDRTRRAERPARLPPGLFPGAPDR